MWSNVDPVRGHDEEVKAAASVCPGAQSNHHLFISLPGPYPIELASQWKELTRHVLLPTGILGKLREDIRVCMSLYLFPLCPPVLQGFPLFHDSSYRLPLSCPCFGFPQPGHTTNRKQNRASVKARMHQLNLQICL